MRKPESQKKMLTICVFCIVSLQLSLLWIFNWKYSLFLLDMDSAWALRHAIEMWREKSLFLDSFVYLSSLELDAATFFAVPLYSLLGNWSAALSICHLIVILAFLAVIIDIGRQAGADLWASGLAASFVLTPWSTGALSYSYMLFMVGGQYAFRILTVLVLIDLLLQKSKRKKFFILLVFYGFLLLLTSVSTGNYIFLMGILPVLVYEIIEIISQQTLKGKRWILILFAASFFLVWLGLQIREPAGESHRSNLSLVNAQGLVQNIWNCITGIFLLTGSTVEQPKTAALSLSGILMAGKFLFTLICMGIVPYLLSRLHAFSKKPVVGMASAIALLNLFVLLITNTRYGSGIFEFRYHLLWFCIWLIVVAFCIFWVTDPEMGACPNAWARWALLACSLFLILFCTAGGWKKTRQEVSQSIYPLCRTVQEQASQQQADSVLSITQNFSLGAILRVLDLERPIYDLQMQENAYTLFIGDYYDNQADATDLGSKNLLLASPDQFEALPSYIQNRYTSWQEAGTYRLYWTEQNPWDLQMGFPDDVGVEKDYPYTNGYTTECGVFLDSGILQSNGTGGELLSASGIAATPGNYSLSLQYQSDQTGVIGSLELISENTGQILASQELLGEDFTTRLTIPEITEDTSLRVSVRVGENCLIEISSLEWERQ